MRTVAKADIYIISFLFDPPMEGQQVFNYVVPNSQEPGYTPIYRRNGQT